MRHSLPVPSSEHVLQRFGFRVGILLLVALLQASVGYETAFFDLVPLFAGACATLAVIKGEWPLARTLNHWDEACGFGVIAGLG